MASVTNPMLGIKLVVPESLVHSLEQNPNKAMDNLTNLMMVLMMKEMIKIITAVTQSIFKLGPPDFQILHETISK